MNLTFKALTLALTAAWNTVFAAPQVFVHTGICDASAAANLDAQHFVVASDEKNVLWIYDRAKAPSVAAVKVWEHLGIGEKDETDIEGATTIGNRTYWITSHGRNKDGEAAPSRHQFFASEFEARAGQIPALALVGKPYKNLLGDLVADRKKFGKYDFARAATLAPKKAGALNIEGLADTADGKLLIGFRNPIPHGMALVIPLNNPKALIDGAGNPAVKAEFGEAIELNLDGRGIRSIERVDGEYYIVAGPFDDADPAAKALGFGLYKWTGAANARPVALTLPKLADFHPESLIATAAHTLQILSDDGKVGGTACKDRPKEKRSFRSVTVSR
jgi:hypothetical protein